MAIGQTTPSNGLCHVLSLLKAVSLAAVLAGPGRLAVLVMIRLEWDKGGLRVEVGESNGQDPAARSEVVAEVVCTAYTSCVAETDSTPEVTASNKRVAPGMIALSRDLISTYTPGAPFAFGDRVELVGVGTFWVEDTMHRRWSQRADILLPTQEDAFAWGTRTVTLARPAEGEEELVVVLDGSFSTL